MKHPPVQRNARRAQATTPKAAQPPAVGATHRNLDGPPLLEHLRPGGLAERWVRATADPVRPLPGRADLERRFGASLSGVRVHDGPGARSLLDHLGASGAASGSVILLRDGSAATVAHEVAHVLQAGAAGPIAAPLRTDHPAEREAEALARSAGPARVRERLTPGALALRRTALLTRDPEVATAEEPTGVRDLDRDPDVTPTGAEPEAAEPEPAEPESAEPDADAAEPDVAEPDVDDTGDEQAPGAAEVVEGPAPESGEPSDRRRPPDRDVALPPPSADRGIQLREVIHRTQRTWDAGVRTVRSQDLGVCPDVAGAEQPGPVARGPPPPPARPTARDELPVPQLTEPDTTALERARLQVGKQLDEAPARGPPPDVATLTDDERRVRSEDQQRLADRVRAAAGPGARPVETVDPTGPADPARAGTAEQTFRARTEAARTQARRDAAVDVGEDRIGPARDPTTGHDSRLEGVTVPEVDVASRLDEARLGRVATDANAGRVPIAEAVLVRDDELAAVDRTADAQDATRGRVDAGITAAEADLARRCTETRRNRDELRADTRAGVTSRRQEWTAAGENLIDTRVGEGAQLRRTETGRAETIRRDADTRAAATMSDAHADAGRRWEDARGRARGRAEQGGDRSWFRRGVDWVREQIDRLVDWIDRFLSAARRAIDALLDAAAAFAHAIVAAARRTIIAVLDRLQALLERLAAALPSELGELARTHLGRIQEFLGGARKRVDTWADDLHRAIDDRIGELKTGLHAALDDLQAGVHDVAAGVDGLLANGLLEFLRRQFPGLAALIDTGLDGVVRSAADGLDAWVTAALEVTGLADLERTLDDLDIDALCQTRDTQESQEQQAEDCAALQQRLVGAMELVEELLASPAARQIQDFLRRRQQAELGSELDALESFFDFVHAVVAPVYRWWQETSATVERAIETLGEVAGAAWRHIAAALGIDPDLGPLEALRRGIQALWQAVVDAARPLVDALRQAWRWLSEGSALAPLFTLIGRLPELWTVLKDLWNRVAAGAADWLASAADALSRTVLPVVNALLGAVSGVAVAVVDALDAWSGAVLAAVDAVLGWRAGLALLDAVLRAVDRVTSPVRRLLEAARSCLVATMRWLAVQIRDLASHVRVLLDVATGLAMALLSFPIGMVGFLAGNVWLHVLPACYKPAIIDFLLDVAIRFVRFLPEPVELGHLILYQGLLSFLVALRTAPAEQKVGAVDLLASLYAGNAEFMAGFVVGALEGIWAATGGTVIFLLQAALWLASLPFKLAAWSVGMLSGALQDREGAGADGEIATDQPGRDTEPDSPTDADLSTPAPQPVPRSSVPATFAPDPQDDDLSRSGDSQDAAPAPAGSRAVLATDAGTGDRQSTEPLPSPEEQGAENALTVAQEEASDTEASAGRDTANSEVSAADPPGAPAALPELGDVLQRLVTEGLTREDLRQALEAARGIVRATVDRLARAATAAMLDALIRKGAAYDLGRTVGLIVGQLVAEVVLAALTAGATAAIAAMKATIQGAKVTARLVQVIRKVRPLLEPIVEIAMKIRSAIGDLLRAIRHWIDDVIEWMRGLGRRAGKRWRKWKNRNGPKGKPKKKKKKKKPGRKRGPEDERRDRARLRLAVAAIRPRLNRALRDGVGRVRLHGMLRSWQYQFGLSSLRLMPGGRIVARVNPAEPVRTVASLPPSELGRILRQVLEAAHRRHLGHVRATQSGTEARRAAEKRIKDVERKLAGPTTKDGSVGQGVSRGERMVLLAGKPSPLGRLSEVEAALAGPAGQGSGVASKILRPSPFPATRSSRWEPGVSVKQDPYKTGVVDLATTFITMPKVKVGGVALKSARDTDLGPTLHAVARHHGLSDEAVTRIVAAPERSRAELVTAAASGLKPRDQRGFVKTMGRLFARVSFRDDLESGRNPGLGVANAVARQLGSQPGGLSLQQQFTQGGGYAPATLEDVASTNPRLRAAALDAADADVGRIFQRLDEVSRSATVYEAGTFDPRPLARALQRYLDVLLLDMGSRSGRAARSRSADLLIRELVALLELYD